MQSEGIQKTGIDASDIEHLGAMAAGGLLLAMGFLRGGVVGSLFKIGGAFLVYRGSQGYRPLYHALGAEIVDKPSGVSKRSVRVESSVEVDRPVGEVYRIWRNLENLPVFMDDLIEVREIDDLRSHWVAHGPAGTVIQWDAQIINDVENEVIAWETLEGSGVDNAGSVNFDDLGGSRTRVQIVLLYDPPAHGLGAWVAKVSRTDPQTQIDRDLQRFKRILEIGSQIAAPQAQVL